MTLIDNQYMNMRKAVPIVLNTVSDKLPDEFEKCEFLCINNIYPVSLCLNLTLSSALSTLFSSILLS